MADLTIKWRCRICTAAAITIPHQHPACPNWHRSEGLAPWLDEQQWTGLTPEQWRTAAHVMAHGSTVATRVAAGLCPYIADEDLAALAAASDHDVLPRIAFHPRIPLVAAVSLTATKSPFTSMAGQVAFWIRTRQTDSAPTAASLAEALDTCPSASGRRNALVILADANPRIYNEVVDLSGAADLTRLSKTVTALLINAATG
jgi:hypothetical protein